ncbi:hypothetical protein CDL12_03795 [Handroanthus impetiginosus]|uniref:Uncharacterized protein n=1 Tax=Handroanthus impetiginosus TaxID=429701 RepID=A0A2G9I137_9LAMI|nr:hypothetical protein CDL12_03795 [Handroanthus impetiginosus]
MGRKEAQLAVTDTYPQNKEDNREKTYQTNAYRKLTYIKLENGNLTFYVLAIEIHNCINVAIRLLIETRYGFMFGRESARKELGDLIKNLRRSNSDPASTATQPRSSLKIGRKYNRIRHLRV